MSLPAHLWASTHGTLDAELPCVPTSLVTCVTGAGTNSSLPSAQTIPFQYPELDLQSQDFWPDEWLQESSLWNPTPACPPECQDELAVEWLSSAEEQAEQAHLFLPEQTPGEATEALRAVPKAKGNSNTSGRSSSDSPQHRRRPTLSANNREHQRNYRNRQRVR